MGAFASGARAARRGGRGAATGRPCGPPRGRSRSRPGRRTGRRTKERASPDEMAADRPTSTPPSKEVKEARHDGGADVHKRKHTARSTRGRRPARRPQATTDGHARHHGAREQRHRATWGSRTPQYAARRNAIESADQKGAGPPSEARPKPREAGQATTTPSRGPAGAEPTARRPMMRSRERRPPIAGCPRQRRRRSTGARHVQNRPRARARPPPRRAQTPKGPGGRRPAGAGRKARAERPTSPATTEINAQKRASNAPTRRPHPDIAARQRPRQDAASRGTAGVLAPR